MAVSSRCVYRLASAPVTAGVNPSPPTPRSKPRGSAASLMSPWARDRRIAAPTLNFAAGNTHQSARTLSAAPEVDGGCGFKSRRPPCGRSSIGRAPSLISPHCEDSDCHFCRKPASPVGIADPASDAGFLMIPAHGRVRQRRSLPGIAGGEDAAGTEDNAASAADETTGCAKRGATGVVARNVVHPASGPMLLSPPGTARPPDGARRRLNHLLAIRRQIVAGTYLTPAKLETAIERMTHDETPY